MNPRFDSRDQRCISKTKPTLSCTSLSFECQTSSTSEIETSTYILLKMIMSYSITWLLFANRFAAQKWVKANYIESKMFVYDSCERGIRLSCIERRCSKMISVRKLRNYIFQRHDIKLSNWQSTQWFRSHESRDLCTTRNRPIRIHNDV